jgi:hypothetical protein
MDQVLRKAMERRDEALREVERWENWIKAYVELAEPVDPLEIPMSRSTGASEVLADELDIASTLLSSDIAIEGSKGRGSWQRNGNAN